MATVAFRQRPILDFCSGIGRFFCTPMPRIQLRRENIREKQRTSENFRELRRRAFGKELMLCFFFLLLHPSEIQGKSRNGSGLFLNHLRILYCYERKIDARGAAGRGLRCAESEE